MSIQDRIRHIRKEHKLTQKEFGEKINISSRSHMTRIENGDRPATDRILDDICRAFAVNKEWLLTGEGDMRADDALFVKTMGEALYDLSPSQKDFVIHFTQMNNDERELFAKFFNEFIKKRQ